MKREFRLLCGLLAATLLVACSSSGKVTLGSGQTSQGSTTDFGIAYVKRTLPADPTALAAIASLDDLRLHRTFWSKADVYIRDRAAPSGVERNVTARVTGTDFYDIKDLDVSPDGTRLVFAMRGPLVATQKDFDPPTWRVWEYDIAADNLHSLTDDVTAAAGHDISPHYLPADATHPTGRILITSTRQRYSKGVLLQEGKSGFEAQTEDAGKRESAFTLTVLDPTLTGPSAFQQISFNQSHDIDPSVMADGRILFSRWDHAPGGNNGMHLYTMNPDGTDLQLLYGAHSHAVGSPDATGAATTVQFVKARQMQDGRVIALIRPTDAGTDFGGNLVILDVANSVECAQRTLGASGSAGSGPCPAQLAATQNDVRTIPGPSPGGRFNSAFPLWDRSGRILVSWTSCRLLDTTGTMIPCTASNLAAPNPLPAPPLYSAWIFDPTDNTLKPVVPPTEGVMLTDIVSLQARSAPAFVAPVSTTSTLALDGLGIIDIRSVYDWGDAAWPGIGAASPASFITTMASTNADARPARFLRVEKAVSMGDFNLNDGFPNFDRAIALDHSLGYMREILAYVPIEADGSVRVKLPANVAFQVSVVDANAQLIQSFPRHRVWLQLRPGEVLACNGCHGATSGTSVTSHGRPNLFASANAGDASGLTQAQQLYGNNTDCGTQACDAATPSVNVSYVGSGAPGDTTIDLGYGTLTAALPTSIDCNAAWSAGCRITIDYAPSATTTSSTPANIRPLWSASRAQVCTSCHTSTRVVTPAPTCTPQGSNTPLTLTLHRAPDGALDLDTDPQQQPTAQDRAYLQLLTTHTTPGTETYNTTTCAVLPGTPVTRSASIVAGNAAGSRFFDVLFGRPPVGMTNHSGFMTPGDLRLLSEWVDIGAQYYNNPFAAPLN